MPEQTEVDFTRGHTDPDHLPSWMCDEWPAAVCGYATAAYLTGVQVGHNANTPIPAEETP